MHISTYRIIIYLAKVFTDIIILLSLFLFSQRTTLDWAKHRQFSNHSEIILKITRSHAVIISSWSQGNWGLGIKPGRSTGTASHMVQAKVTISDGLLCPASLGTWAHWCWYDGDGLCHVTGSPCRSAWFYTQAPIPLGPRWDNHCMELVISFPSALYCGFSRMF